VLGPDDALPPERDLASDFSVSRITVRKAIDGLVSEGMLVRRQGSGTFVRARVEKNFSKLTSFSEDSGRVGATRAACGCASRWARSAPRKRSRCVRVPALPCTASIAFASRTMRRWHSIRDHPRLLPAIGRCGGVIAVRGARARRQSSVRALQRLRAVLFSAEQAELLQAKERDAGLLVERVGFLNDGRAAEFTRPTIAATSTISSPSSAIPREDDQPSTRMYREAAQAPERCANSCRPTRRASRDSPNGCDRRHRAPRHLRARQLRSRRHLWPLPHRDALGFAHLLGGPIGELRLRRTAGSGRCGGAGDLAVGGQPRSAATVSSARAPARTSWRW